MNTVFVSNFCSKITYEALIPKDFRMGQQYQKYFRLIAEGLACNDCAVSTLTVPPVNRRNSTAIILRPDPDVENNVSFNYLHLINIPVIKNICVFFSCFFSVAKLHRKNSTVVLDLLNATICLATYMGSRISRVKILGVLTDMPTVYVGNENSKPSFQQKLSQFLCRNCPDAYLFITKEMGAVVNVHRKPYLVVEGFADLKMKEHANELVNKSNPKVCFYAGGLNKLYGVDMLVDGFLKANIDNCILKMCGDGLYAKELSEIAKNNANVEYCGVLNNDEVIDLEEKATLLINPRYTSSEFNKYSFPSKNMEYISTGTPLLTTRLPGMPNDYYPHIFLLSDETVDGMSSELIRIFSIPDESLHQKGIEAKNWILEKKNNVESTKALKKLMEDL